MLPAQSRHSQQSHSTAMAQSQHGHGTVTARSQQGHGHPHLELVGPMVTPLPDEDPEEQRARLLAVHRNNRRLLLLVRPVT